MELLNEFGDILLTDDSVDENIPPACDNPIYCSESVLSVIQNSNAFQDSKTFVDMSCKNSVNDTLENFYEFLKNTDHSPNADQVQTFVMVSFIYL